MTKSTVPLLTEADAALRRFGELWRRGRDGSVEPGLLEEVMEELSVALHELQTSADELREQQEQLLRAEARIAEERRRYHELFEFGPDGYLVTTGTAVIRESNRMAATLPRLECRLPHRLRRRRVRLRRSHRVRSRGARACVGRQFPETIGAPALRACLHTVPF